MTISNDEKELHRLRDEVTKLKAEKQVKNSQQEILPIPKEIYQYTEYELKFAFEFISTTELQKFLNFNSER